jgi:metal-dependent hydrolase (beta-lactamase superfamily II)
MKHSILFDTGPEEEVFQRNAERLGVDLSTVEVIQLSHWHRDHSGTHFASPLSASVDECDDRWYAQSD